MKPKFTTFNKDSNWVKGKIGKYNFEAKLFDEGSEFGINWGRVSKLSIFDDNKRIEEQNFLKACMVHYDRGWDIKPAEEHRKMYNEVLEFLEKAPLRFTQEYSEKHNEYVTGMEY